MGLNSFRRMSFIFLHVTFLVLAPVAKAEVAKYIPSNIPDDVSAVLQRVMVLSGDSMVKRPISVARVKSALKKVKPEYSGQYEILVEYLARFDARAAVTSTELFVSSSADSESLRANGEGQSFDSNYRFNIAGYVQPSSWLNVNVGGYVYDAKNDNDGNSNSSFNSTYISLFGGPFQIDVGMREHWLGPFQSADMLMSTQAANAPSITISNVSPLTKYGIYYEVFYSELSESDSILNRDTDERETGNPKLFGFHLSVNPFEGFSLGINRLLQYGGGSRDESMGGLFDAFFSVKSSDNIGTEGKDFGNQLSSITTKYTFNDGVPLSIYMEYAGEDTAQTSDFHIGNTAMMAGFNLPSLWQRYDFTYEYSSWQNSWYVNGNYGDGLSHNNVYLGHWASGVSSYSARLGAETHYVKLGSQISARTYAFVKFYSVKSVTITGGEPWSFDLLSLHMLHRVGKHRFELILDVGDETAGRFSTISGVWRW